MKNHPKNTTSLALMTVVALVVTAWPNSVVADDTAPLLLDIREHGVLFNVLRREKKCCPDHQDMKIAVVQTQTEPEVTYGLVLLQTGGGVRGEGIICEPLELISDGFLRCEQTFGGKKEILKIGVVGSEFCNDLWVTLDKDPERRTPNGKNPVAKTTDECGKTTYCICYDVEHATPGQTRSAVRYPPNNGSGTGGHN